MKHFFQKQYWHVTQTVMIIYGFVVLGVKWANSIKMIKMMRQTEFELFWLSTINQSRTVFLTFRFDFENS